MGTTTAGDTIEEVTEDKRNAKRGKSQIKELLALAEEGIEPFHDREGIAYARVSEGNRNIVALIDGNDFKHVLRHRYYVRHQSGPNDEALNTAIRTLQARACFDGERYDVHLRGAQHDGTSHVKTAP